MIKMFSKLLPIVIILQLVVSSVSQFTCGTAQGPVALGGSTVVCLHIHREGNTDISTYAFKTNVDTFSALKVNGLQAKIVQLIKTTVTPIYATIQLANNQSVTRPMLIADQTKSLYRSVLSFVVTVDGGNITQIVDDNTDCSVCDTSNTQTCQSTTNRCFDKTFSDIDPRVFTSWIGTDSQNNYMLSHTRRLSRLTQYSIGNLYQGLVSQFKAI